MLYIGETKYEIFYSAESACESKFVVPKGDNSDNFMRLQFICRASWHMVLIKVMFTQHTANKNTFLKPLVLLICIVITKYLLNSLEVCLSDIYLESLHGIAGLRVNNRRFQSVLRNIFKE